MSPNPGKFEFEAMKKATLVAELQFRLIQKNREQAREQLLRIRLDLARRIVTGS